MHYLNYLAEKLAQEMGKPAGEGNGGESGEEKVRAMRAVLEAEVEGGRLRYNLLRSGGGIADGNGAAAGQFLRRGEATTAFATADGAEKPIGV